MGVARAAMLTAALNACAQGTFQNLDFESANVPFVPAGQFGSDVAVSNGVPGWNVYIGSGQAATMLHNNISLGGATEVAIFGPQWFSSQILQGSYTVSLEPATVGPLVLPAIGQTGRIPFSAQSVNFYGESGGTYALMFAGQQIPLIALSSTSAYTVYGGDISGFAGQTGELRFQGGGLLDNVFFSNQPVPEPSIEGLFVLGGLVFAWRKRRPRKMQ